MASVLLVVGLAGCDTATNDGGPPKVTSTPAVTENSVLPLESYLLTSTQKEELRQSYQAILAKCAAGFSAKAEPASTMSKLEQDSRMWGGRFGTMSEAHAAKYGYHAGPSDPVAPSIDIFANQSSEPLYTILFGADDSGINNVPGQKDSSPGDVPPGLPDGGCVGKTVGELSADPEDLVPAEIEKMRLAAFRDDRTDEAKGTWVSCMAGMGFKFKSVDGPADQFSDGRPLSAEEVAVAKADVACTKSSRWRDISFAIEKAYQERSLAQDPEKWDAVRTKSTDVLNKAKRMAASS